VVNSTNGGTGARELRSDDLQFNLVEVEIWIMTDQQVVFRSLSREEIHALLSRNHVGRIAYCKGHRIEIEPLHYVYSGGWIYGRTSHNGRHSSAGDGWWPVAFEVDEVKDLSEWTSVVIHGGFYTLSENGATWEQAERVRAIEIIRTLVPEAFTRSDPTPFRNVVFRIAVQEVSGRANSCAPSGSNPPITPFEPVAAA
jgi:uncharacterized protein